ncbi:hypothetical protein QWY14_02365 [Planococcus sp. N028]|uniref:Uncharacterized protein n=1 Tax=Planococcus shixiaomingii TaxID=3058393 RepID=A0ABT8MYA1_9BACL|nr:hypothetical protein [Planococcus sp. N028]MDN7240611.1 hypothetical protein [Planococcus sp. N028]
MEIVEYEIFNAADLKLNSWEIKDADWRTDLGLLAILKQKEQFKVIVGNDNIFTPSLLITVEYPIVRWVNKERILLANPRNETGEDNVFLLDVNGCLLNSFNAGDGIMDIVVKEEGIWFSYFDEGVFGEGISREGLVLFSFSGNPLFVYHSGLSDRPFLTSCDAMCVGDGAEVWIFPIMMPDVDPALLKVNAKSNTITSILAPELPYEPTALSVRGKDVYFSSQFDPEGNLYYWEIGTENPQLAGQLKGTIRSLQTSDPYPFVAVTEKTIKLIRVFFE